MPHNYKMRILFIEPPVNYPNVNVNVGSNLGLLMIISELKKKGYWDLFFYSFEYAKLFQKEKNTIDVLEQYLPDIVCISVLTHSFQFAKEFSKYAKDKNCIVIWGGIFVTQLSDRIISLVDNVDYFVVGEGEYSFVELIDNISHHNKSSTKNMGQIIYCNQPYDLNRSTNPDYSIIPKIIIKNHNLRATLETSRGCNFDCKFSRK